MTPEYFRLGHVQVQNAKIKFIIGTVNQQHSVSFFHLFQKVNSSYILKYRGNLDGDKICRL